uniref:Reverse transcriptase domain-containing protein n=1 Tax=Tanacetum cinerariifolium TaxID=118510 RepID=A0A6L2KBY7_TANCI|nr:hypothetical protein [Tanacetum cinerariifolium]
MRDEHLDTIPAMESNEVIKSSVEDLISIPSEFEGIPDTMCDVHLVNNPTLLEAKDHFEIALNSNDDISSSDNDSLYKENIEYIEASPHDSEVVSLEAIKIVTLEVEEIEDDNLREKLLNVYLLIANIEALKDNPTQSSEFLTNDSTTTHSDISLPDYEAFSFNNDHIKEISSGSTTTHSDISLSEYDSFIFDLTHKEFADKLAHIISPPEYDRFYFWNLPDPVEDDYSPLLTYVVWIFLAYLTYLVIPLYLHPFGNEDTIFDPGITINHFYLFKPGLSHRLLHLAGSQPMLKSTYKAKDGVIISIPPLVGGVADVVVEIKGTGERKPRKEQNRDKTRQKQEATVGHDATYEMTCKSLMKMITEAHSLRSEVKKLEIELWNLTVKESDKAKKYVGGVPDNIQRNVMSDRPKMLQEAIELENSLMDQKVRAYSAKQADNKRRMDNNPKENQIQQPPYKRQNVARAYTVGRSVKKEYAGTLPLCNKCKLHHNGS